MTDLINSISAIRATAISICSALYGSWISTISVDVALQRGAWTIAIVAGIFGIINYIKIWFFSKSKEGKKDEADTKKDLHG